MDRSRPFFPKTTVSWHNQFVHYSNGKNVNHATYSEWLWESGQKCWAFLYSRFSILLSISAQRAFVSVVFAGENPCNTGWSWQVYLTMKLSFNVNEQLKMVVQNIVGDPKTGHSNMENIQNPDVFVLFLNGSISLDCVMLIFFFLYETVYASTIWKLGQLWTYPLSTIWKPNTSGFRIPTVLNMIPFI